MWPLALCALALCAGAQAQFCTGSEPGADSVVHFTDDLRVNHTLASRGCASAPWVELCDTYARLESNASSLLVGLAPNTTLASSFVDVDSTVPAEPGAVLQTPDTAAQPATTFSWQPQRLVDRGQVYLSEHSTYDYYGVDLALGADGHALVFAQTADAAGTEPAFVLHYCLTLRCDSSALRTTTFTQAELDTVPKDSGADAEWVSTFVRVLVRANGLPLLLTYVHSATAAGADSQMALATVDCADVFCETRTVHLTDVPGWVAYDSLGRGPLARTAAALVRVSAAAPDDGVDVFRAPFELRPVVVTVRPTSATVTAVNVTYWYATDSAGTTWSSTELGSFATNPADPVAGWSVDVLAAPNGLPVVVSAVNDELRVRYCYALSCAPPAAVTAVYDATDGFGSQLGAANVSSHHDMDAVLNARGQVLVVYTYVEPSVLTTGEDVYVGFVSCLESLCASAVITQGVNVSEVGEALRTVPLDDMDVRATLDADGMPVVLVSPYGHPPMFGSDEVYQLVLRCGTLDCDNLDLLSTQFLPGFEPGSSEAAVSLSAAALSVGADHTFHAVALSSFAFQQNLKMFSFTNPHAQSFRAQRFAAPALHR